jgi:predicted CoA-binding protein
MASTHSHHSVPGTVWRRERRLAQRGSIVRDPITSILEKYKTLAVVGLSSKPRRPSCGVAAYMQRHGYRIIPVNPNESSVLGERSYPTLESIPESFGVVVIFRQAQYVPALVESAIARGACVIWMQEGIAHEEAAERARSAGLEVVQDRCILKEHAKRYLSEGI